MLAVSQWAVRTFVEPINRFQICFRAGPAGKNTYQKTGASLRLLISDARDHRFHEAKVTLARLSGWSGMPRIESVRLFFPRQRGDPRWQSLSLPAAPLFLGSALLGHGFAVQAATLDLPVANPEQSSAPSDREPLVGFTVFEDLFPELQEHIARLRLNFSGIIAVGGPMPTLAPLATIFHLPQVNLFVRGEAELVLPRLLRALNRHDLAGLLRLTGFWLEWRNWIVASRFDVVERQERFRGFRFRLDFMQSSQFNKGLEINLTRGCRRRCFFCCRVQGPNLRRLPLPKVSGLLKEFHDQLERRSLSSGESRTININDDDILQDETYAAMVFRLIKEHGFRLWGIQTSLQSFLDGDGSSRRALLELIDDPRLFVGSMPRLWLGTDTFLVDRGRRLGKKVPPPAVFHDLFEHWRKRNVCHFHYWISSDHNSDWNEFCMEWLLILKFAKEYDHFRLLAHAPFLIPYPATPIYSLILKNGLDGQLRLKKNLTSASAVFQYPLVSRVETAHESLNRLLRNEPDGLGLRFFDCLKNRDYRHASLVLLYFLKQERIQAELSGRFDRARELQKVESGFQEAIAFSD